MHAEVSHLSSLVIPTGDIVLGQFLLLFRSVHLLSVARDPRVMETTANVVVDRMTGAQQRRCKVPCYYYQTIHSHEW